VRELERRGDAREIRASFEASWRDEAREIPDRLNAGRALARMMPPGEWLARFPVDMETTAGAVLLRADVLAASGATNEAMAQLTRVVPNLADVRPSHARRAASILMHVGATGPAWEVCERALATHPAVRAALGRRRALDDRREKQRDADFGDSLQRAVGSGVAAEGAVLDWAAYLAPRGDVAAVEAALGRMPADHSPLARDEAVVWRARALRAGGNAAGAVRLVLDLLPEDGP
jgi:hypothetical protein